MPPLFIASNIPLRHYQPLIAATMTFFTNINTVEIET
jgi:hypothetical protein